MLAGLKLLEMKSERDYYILCFISLFLLLTGFFYSQSIASAVHAGVAVIVVITAMASLNDRQSVVAPGKRLQLGAQLVGIAIPVLLVLFILFPRIDGPLWGLPKDARAATSGLDDEMSPGQISQLTLSNEVAFRVSFDGPVPDKAFLYWRGPVLWFSDGVKWVGDRISGDRGKVDVYGDPITYTVTLEPTGKNWLYGLEMPVSTPKRTRLSHDLQLRTASAVFSRRRYQLTSHLEYSDSATDTSELEKALQLPRTYHSRAVELGRSLRARGLDDQAIIAYVLDMFNTEPFYYTLNPPLLLNDSVTSFYLIQGKASVSTIRLRLRC